MMKKWCVIDSRITKSAIETIEAFDSKAEALAAAESAWNHMSAYDRKYTDSFVVALCNVQKEPAGWEYAELDDGTIDCDWYYVAKEYK